jgi:cell division protein FtsL
MTEFFRFLRHLFGPIVVYAVETGWLPESAQGDGIEVLVMAFGFGVPYLISWWRDKKRQGKV